MALEVGEGREGEEEDEEEGEELHRAWIFGLLVVGFVYDEAG